VILHWLGEAFDPALRGYWGSTDLDARRRSCSTSSGRTPTAWTASRCPPRRRAGVDLRRRLPAGVRLYTATTSTTTR
jgi:hypothetical protein